jgi:hypothetical protein
MKYIAFGAGLLIAVNSMAGLINFDLRNDPELYSKLDERSVGSVTNTGLVATFTASDGVLNRTASGFGVNGTGTDDTDALNTGQYIDLSFSRDVVFTSLIVSSWGAGDAGVVQFGPALVSQESIPGSGEAAFNIVLPANETLRVKATADSGATNGFSMDGFAVTVPEPATLGLLGFGSGLIWMARRGRPRKD